MNPQATDMEVRAHADHHASLRLWLRLLSATTRIEDTIRQRLREQFGITLPRFDLMAQLEREPEGLSMGELSRRMMVTGGNVTAIVDQLEKEQLVQRQSLPGDRRAFRVSLTPAGRLAFDAIPNEFDGRGTVHEEANRDRGDEPLEEAAPGDDSAAGGPAPAAIAAGEDRADADT